MSNQQTPPPDDTDFARHIMMQGLKVGLLPFVNEVLRFYMVVDEDHRVTFIDIPDKHKAYLRKLVSDE